MDKPSFPVIRVWKPEEVKQIRAVFGYTQAKFGRFFPVEAKTIAAWENGRRNPYGPCSTILQDLEEYTNQVTEEKRLSLGRLLKK